MTTTSADVMLPPTGSTFVGVLLRNRVTLLAGLIGGAILGLSVAVLASPTYESQAVLVVAPAPSDDPGAAIRAVDILDNQNRLVLNSVAELAESPLARREAIRRSGLDGGPYEVYGALGEDTNLVIVAATAPTPSEATTLAAAAARVAIDEATRLLTAYRIDVLEPPLEPEVPGRPVPWVLGLAGSLIGLVVAMGIVDVRLRARRRR